MSSSITLTLRARPARTIEVDGITGDRMAALSEHEIAKMQVWAGRESSRVGDFFDVKGGHSSSVRIEGDLDRVDGLGAAMEGGELIVTGRAGRNVGRGMSGGLIVVHGDVGDDAGVAMSGGVLRVHGGAGDRLGGALPGAARGMTGGEIVVSGAAGAAAATRCRRGVIVAGSAGPDAGEAMIAGTLVVLGAAGERPGRGNRRGSIIAAGSIEPPDTYRYACTFQPPHVRLLLTHLHRRFGLPIGRELVEGCYRRFCGDVGEPGRGEILQWSRTCA
jgi:formylmethanofuran dehydrogenase subunit C